MVLRYYLSLEYVDGDMDSRTFCRVDLDYDPKLVRLYDDGGVPSFKCIFAQTLPN
jgi:hypothetical protein